MADCLLLGDSIALGLFGALHAGGMRCAVAAHVGARSAELPFQIARAGRHQLVILSTGSNDPPGAPLDANLIAARMALAPMRVVWVLPYRRRSAYSITQVAFRFGDGIVDLSRYPSRDRIHPASYGQVAAALRR